MHFQTRLLPKPMLISDCTLSKNFKGSDGIHLMFKWFALLWWFMRHLEPMYVLLRMMPGNCQNTFFCSLRLADILMIIQSFADDKIAYKHKIANILMYAMTSQCPLHSNSYFKSLKLGGWVNKIFGTKHASWVIE